MKQRLMSWLSALEPRVLLGLLAALVLFVVLESWLLVLRAPLAEWRALVAKRQASETLAPAALAPQIEQLSRDIAHTEQALQSVALPSSDDDTVLRLIATFDRAASRHGVGLGSVKAGGRRVEQEFELVSFEVEARGAYRALIDWLAESETQVAPLNVIELTLSAVDEARQVALKVKFAAYLPMHKTGTGT